jgi:hypothetical protein
MGRFTKRLITGLTTACFLAVGGAFAQSSTLADFENGTNQNLFGQYWYFFDDTKEESTITGEKRATTSKVHSGEYKGDEILFGDAAIATGSGAQSGNNGGLLNFTWGGTMQMAYGPKGQPLITTCPPNNGATGCYPFEAFVGIGTNLAPEGSTSAPAGFESATSIEFYAKASEAIDVQFKVQMAVGIEDNGDYQKIIEVGTGWTKFTVALNTTDLAQPDWADAVPFNKMTVTKIAWQVQAGGNNAAPAAAEGKEISLWLDNVVVNGFTYVPPDLCTACKGAVGRSVGSLFSDFEADAGNALGFYWYPYDDTKTVVDAGTPAGTSAITAGVGAVEGYDGEGLLVGNDAGGDGNSAYIEFNMGNSMKIGGNTVSPFIGLGADLYDAENDGELYNATAAGVEGIYFEYITHPGITSLDVEVQDFYDINKDRPESAVRYIKIAGTDGQWASATIPFSILTIHDEWEDVAAWYSGAGAAQKLDLTRLAKIQLKYQGGGEGYYLGLDNVYLLGGSEISVKYIGSKASRAAANLRATYTRGTVGVSWNAASSIASGKVQLINTKGRVVASAPIAKGSANKVSASLGAGRLPTGMYFVRVNAKDVTGKKIVQQTPISIVK